MRKIIIALLMTVTAFSALAEFRWGPTAGKELATDTALQAERTCRMLYNRKIRCGKIEIEYRSAIYEWSHIMFKTIHARPLETQVDGYLKRMKPYIFLPVTIRTPDILLTEIYI